MKKKKGISPLIATVLILGFTIALAALIMVWGQRFTTGMQKQTEETANTQIICATEVAFKIKDVCKSTTPAGYKVVVENNGNRKIERMIVRFYESSDKVRAFTDAFSGTGIDGYSIGSVTLNPATGTPTLASVKLVEAIPVILVEGKQVTCSANNQEFGSLEGAAITTACTS